MADLAHAKSSIKTEVCVLGGGPAGAALARRLCQLGHAVVVVERAAFPRAHVGESIVSSVLPLLDVLDVRNEIERAGFLRPAAALVCWTGRTECHQFPGAPGFQVDRGRFDQLLLRAAASAGAQILQPACALRTQRLSNGNWLTHLRTATAELAIESRFLADATGRAGLLPGVKRRLGRKTLALYAYWRNVPLAGPETRVEAGEEFWYWGAPLPDGAINATVFLDPSYYRRGVAEIGSEQFYESLLARSELLAACLQGERTSPVQVCDATPLVDEQAATACTIKVGEAAFAIDPLSSQGVQTAIGSAVHAATVVHTILRRPADEALATDFYCQRQSESVVLHARAAGQFYAEAARSRLQAFWQARASETGEIEPAPLPRSMLLPDSEIRLAPGARFEMIPTAQGEFIVATPAIIPPATNRAVAFLDGIAVAPLARLAQEPIRAEYLLQAWTQQVSLDRAAELLRWLWQAGVLTSA